jgi:hypothetical protein
MHKEQYEFVSQGNTGVFRATQTVQVKVFKLASRKGYGIIICFCQGRSAFDAAGSLYRSINRFIFDVSQKSF